MYKLFHSLALLWALCVLPLGFSQGVPVRTDYSGINAGDAEKKYRNRTFASYLSNAAFCRLTKTGSYSSFENPTGIFFEQDEKVKISLSGLPQGQAIKLIVHDFEKNGRHDEYPLHNGVNNLTMKNRGLGYVDYRGDSPAALPPPVKMKIRGGKINGVFTRSDSEATWKRLLAHAKCNMLDMLGERCQLTYNVDGLIKGCPVKGPRLLMLYDEIIRMQQEDILGWHLDRTHPGNHIHGRAMWSGYMHADGLGAAFHVDTIPGISNPDRLLEGAWGVAHEFGHVNQTRPGMRWTGMTEVTNNIFSSWTNYRLNPSHMRLEHELTGNADGVRMVGGRFDCYVNNAIVRRQLWLFHAGPDSGTNLGKRAGDVFVTLCPYWQLQLYIAVAGGKKDFFPNIFHAVRYTDESKMSNGQLQLLFIKRACDAAHLDLTDFFAQVGMLSPMNREMEDYSRAYITITEEMCRDVMQHISTYPKPDSSVIYYITANTVDIYRQRLKVLPPAENAPPPVIRDGKIEISPGDWENAVAFEAYRQGKLVRISLRGLNHKDGKSTTIVCPEGTDCVKAVQWDGKRYTLLSPNM